ncbi:enhancer of rudimentary homolog [Zophobas morio]|uniref:enhancer of rudimentary homolog n=1 Tax=Zophobas morio TaxID=2755281 RepID=UPI003082EBD6
MAALFKFYEEHLKRLGPSEDLVYGLEEILNYIDSLHDCCCLVFNDLLLTYEPKDKIWIKNTITGNILDLKNLIDSH